MKNAELSYNELLDNIFAFTRLSNINQSLPRAFESGEALYISEIYILHLIGERGVCTATELATHTHKTLSAISQIVTKLHRKDIVCKTTSTVDKKLINLSLSLKGASLLREHIRDDENYYATLYPYMQHFSADELSKVSALICALSEQTLNSIMLKKSIVSSLKNEKVSIVD